MDTKTLQLQADQESAELINRAYETIPEAYHGYIVILPQRRNAGTPQTPAWVTSKRPYMTVDGRIRMAVDEHNEKGAKLSIKTDFVSIVDGKVVCRATLESTHHGSVIGHSAVNIGGRGVDATSPFENAETSAVGRALGFMGYGLLGHGIASADEVQHAQSQEEPDERAVPDMTQPSTGRPGTGPSEKQVVFLRQLMEQQGNSPEQIDLRLQQVHTRAEASALIEKLRQPSEVRNFWLRWRELTKGTPFGEEALRTYLKETYDVESTKDLVPAQLEDVLSHFRQAVNQQIMDDRWPDTEF